jgi:hypothetical protein
MNFSKPDISFSHVGVYIVELLGSKLSHAQTIDIVSTAMKAEDFTMQLAESA